MKIDGRIAANKKRQKITDDQILSDIAEGLTRQEIADRHGVHVENLARRMKALGVHAKYAKCPKRQQEYIAETWHRTERAQRLVERHQDGFEFIEFKRRVFRLRCKTCGNVIERDKSTIRQKRCLCDECERKRQEEKELQEERIRLMRSFYAILELKKPKRCVRCGEEFFSQYANQQYCSKKCKRHNGTSIRHRCRKYGRRYDPSVTPRKIFERDGYICRICGLACDKNDRSWNGFFGAYSPTVDHIIALANGGDHTWDNVQCAHAICNSYKRDISR